MLNCAVQYTIQRLQPYFAFAVHVFAACVMATGGRDANDVNCPRCGSVSSSIDGDTVRWCRPCNAPFGIDDSCNPALSACSECGATDANDFEFRLLDGAMSLACVRCGTTLMTGVTSEGSDGAPTGCHNNEDFRTPDVGSFECPKCTNNDDQFFRAEYNLKTGRLYKVQCLVCGHGNTNKENAPVTSKSLDLYYYFKKKKLE
jgi:transcription elongation factor Elf1